MATMPAVSIRATDTARRPGAVRRPARDLRPDLDTYRRRRRATQGWTALASERAGAWSARRDASPSGRAVADAAPEGPTERPGADGERDAHRSNAVGGALGLDRLDGAVAEAIGFDLDTLSEEGISQRLDRLHRPIARLGAERARLTAELERRRVATLGDPAARERARRDLRRQLAERTNSTPAATKRDADAGRFADQHRRTGASFAGGALSADHVRLIGDTLAALPPGRRDAVETELLALAQRTNPTSFGRRAREILAREAPAESDRAVRRQHRQRRVRGYDTPDGGFAFSGLLYGDMAETARVAFDAFRRPDTPDEHRSPEQRSADAFEQLCAAALRVGDAPTRHGVRPHVIITLTADQLALGDRGVARFGSGQPATLGQLRTLVADCTWGRVLLGPDSTPIEASKTVRTVPAGLWRVLVARDAGCTWPGCDAPPAWCDVAHGAVAFAEGGQLSPANAALLCRRHHRRFDLGGWQIAIEGRTVHYHHDQSVPERGHAPGSPMPPQGRAPGTGPARDREDGGEDRANQRPRARGRSESGAARAPATERPTGTLTGAGAGTAAGGEQVALPLPPALADP